jgi:glycosyltransferase involved in cell wall biosynthesis
MVEAAQPRRAIVFFSNTSWYLWNFRTRLAVEVRASGYDVLFVAPDGEYGDRLRDIGRFELVRLERKGKNPLREVRSILEIAELLKREQPLFVLTWTPKPNIYCGLISRFSKTRVVPNVSGLGSAFQRRGLLSWLVVVLYRIAFRDLPTVFFQNDEDLEALTGAGCVRHDAAVRLPGSGVDLERFTASPMPANQGLVFLFGGRLLKEKGLPELIAAMRKLQADGLPVSLRVYGHFDPGNPSAVTEEEMESWVSEGVADYRGSSDNMEQVIRDCDCVVHPSYYREGVPRILLEAAASARPAITTDNIGCRDAVEPGVTGLLCRPRDVDSLGSAMRAMLDMPKADRERMGQAARELAVTRFDESIVLRKYLAVIDGR